MAFLFKLITIYLVQVSKEYYIQKIEKLKQPPQQVLLINMYSFRVEEENIQNEECPDRHTKAGLSRK